MLSIDLAKRSFTARVNRITLSYIEGPDNGVLLHAQMLDRFEFIAG